MTGLVCNVLLRPRPRFLHGLGKALHLRPDVFTELLRRGDGGIKSVRDYAIGDLRLPHRRDRQ